MSNSWSLCTAIHINRFALLRGCSQFVMHPTSKSKWYTVICNCCCGTLCWLFMPVLTWNMAELSTTSAGKTAVRCLDTGGASAMKGMACSRHTACLSTGLQARDAELHGCSCTAPRRTHLSRTVPPPAPVLSVPILKRIMASAVQRHHIPSPARLTAVCTACLPQLDQGPSEQLEHLGMPAKTRAAAVAAY